MMRLQRSVVLVISALMVISTGFFVGAAFADRSAISAKEKFTSWPVNSSTTCGRQQVNISARSDGYAGSTGIVSAYIGPGATCPNPRDRPSGHLGVRAWIKESDGTICVTQSDYWYSSGITYLVGMPLHSFVCEGAIRGRVRGKYYKKITSSYVVAPNYTLSPYVNSY